MIVAGLQIAPLLIYLPAPAQKRAKGAVELRPIRACTISSSSEECLRKSNGEDPLSSDQKDSDRNPKSVQSLLLSKLSNTLQTRSLLPPKQKVLVAVSGGQDSISLIFLLKKLQARWGWKLGIAHCDHRWSPYSRCQASHVAQVAAYLELDFYQAVATRDVAGESAARAWRYGVLCRIASSHGYSTIVTAHTGSDRIETLLHNLFRGSGLHGLQALTWKRWMDAQVAVPLSNDSLEETPVEFVENHSQARRPVCSHQIALVRPLLDVMRKDLKEFCDIEKLPLWPDPSNFFMDIRRNKIRHQLLPLLREHFQATVDRSLGRWAEIVSGEDAFLEELCEGIRNQAESSYSFERSKGRLLKLSMIQNLHVAVQRRVIKQFVEAFSSRSLGFDHVEHLRITCIVKSCKNGQCFSLPGNIVLQYLDNAFLISKNQKS